MSKLLEIYRSEATVTVQLLQQRLKDHGIPTVIQGENLASAMGIASFIVPCRLLVREELHAEAEAAMAVMQAVDAEVHENAPESCPACNEPWEAGFEICWNCQAPLP